MRRVAGFFARLHGCRRWAGDGRDVLFTERWVSRKVGLPKATVHRALSQLEACGVLVRGETLPSREGKRRAQLWAPGLREGAAVGVERRAGGVGDAVEPEPHGREELLVRRAVVDREAGGGLVASVGGAPLHTAEGSPGGRR
jgi:IclR helix-turn-helix domain